MRDIYYIYERDEKMEKFILILLICSMISMLDILPVSAEAGKLTARPLGTTDAPFGFYEYLPEGYDADQTKTWPVVIFLHGLGERGNGTTELSDILKHGLPKEINKGKQFPFIAIAPQLSKASDLHWYHSNVVPVIDEMVEYVKDNYRVDTRRIYMTGLSMGGGGTWKYASTHPEKLAAIVPDCGAYKLSDTDSTKIKDLPVWAFHNWGDPTVYATDSVGNCDKIAGKLLGGSATDLLSNYPGTYTGPPRPGYNCDATRTASFSVEYGWRWRAGVENIPNCKLILTLFPGTAHDSWNQTYASQKMWDWLLAQSKGHVPEISEVNVDVDSKMVRINGYGNKNEGIVTVTVKKPSGELDYVGEAVCDGYGKFQVRYEMNKPENGVYSIYIGGFGNNTPITGSFQYEGAQEEGFPIEVTGCKYEKEISEGVYEDITSTGLSAGRIKATVSILNKSPDDSMNVRIICAVYNEGNNGKTLKNIVTGTREISAGTTETEMTLEINVPDALEKPVMKFYIWENMNNKPLSEAIIFE